MCDSTKSNSQHISNHKKKTDQLTHAERVAKKLRENLGKRKLQMRERKKVERDI